MKKKIVSTCIELLVIILIVAIIISSCHYASSKYEKEQNELQKELLKVKAFNLNEGYYYAHVIENFPSDKYLGETLTAEDAREKAVNEWYLTFGDTFEDKKPYQVFLDEENDVWLVTGTIPEGSVGGTPNILIQRSDGKVLAIWGEA